jgi:hypothetical protein
MKKLQKPAFVSDSWNDVCVPHQSYATHRSADEHDLAALVMARMPSAAELIAVAQFEILDFAF